METRPPHRIVDDIRQVPPAQRHNFTPIPKEFAEWLRGVTPEERAAWLAKHEREHAGETSAILLRALRERRAKQAQRAARRQSQR